jgi:O-antigen/teichoic acid export membrane protein
MGKYSVELNILNLLYPIISIGLYAGVLRFYTFINFDAINKYITRYLVFSTVFMALFCTWYLNSLAAALFSFVILFQGRLYILRASLNIKWFGIANIFQKLISLILLLFVVYLTDYEGDFLVEMIFFTIGFSYLTSWLLAGWSAKFNPRVVTCKESVRFPTVLKFCFIAMCTDLISKVLMLSDQIIIEYYYGAESLAPYAVSYRIVSVIALVSGVFLSYYPTMYFRELELNKYTAIVNSRRIFISFILLLSCLLIVFKHEVYFIFGAEDYVDDISYFSYLVFGELARIIGAIYMTYRTFKLQQKYNLSILIFITFLNLCMNFMFIPEYGPIFAAYSTAFCFFVYLAFSALISLLPEIQYVKSKC